MSVRCVNGGVPLDFGSPYNQNVSFVNCVFEQNLNRKNFDFEQKRQKPRFLGIFQAPQKILVLCASLGVTHLPHPPQKRAFCVCVFYMRFENLMSQTSEG